MISHKKTIKQTNPTGLVHIITLFIGLYVKF